MKICSRPEPLEVRIAPAVFLVSSVDTKVFDLTIPATPTDAMNGANELQANTNANSDSAFLMQAGDKLQWDANHNGKADAADPLMVQITSGKAMVFLTDRDSDGAFQMDELTGLAVGNGSGTAFGATIKTDVFGSIATVLDGTDS